MKNKLFLLIVLVTVISYSASGDNTDKTRGFVGPLIQTRWHQGYPLNAMLPMYGNTRSIAGCGTIAHAQIMKYHNHPPRGRGQVGSYKMMTGIQPPVNFEVNYDWSNMRNTYHRNEDSDSTQKERDAVATLIYHIGTANGRDFFTGARDTTALNRERGFVEYFGYDRSIQRLLRIYYDDDTWEAIIREQLDQGLPVYYWGVDSVSDHAFVVDGYDNTGKFHINWGWSGSCNGWYNLNNLNPRGASVWYNDHHIIINIKPDEGGVSPGYEMALRSLTAEKTSVPQNELFAVNFQMQNVNYLDAYPGGQAGAALVDNDDNVAAIIGIIKNFNALNPGSIRTSSINCFVPETVKAGQYRLKLVTRPADGDWKIITMSAVGIPNHIDLTVTAETGAAPGGGYGLAIKAFTVDKDSIIRPERFTVFVRTINMGIDAFPGGSLALALVDKNGKIAGDVIRPFNWGAVTSERAATLSNCSVSNNVPAGQYRLMVVIRPTGSEEWRIATMSWQNAPTSYDFTVK